MNRKMKARFRKFAERAREFKQKTCFMEFGCIIAVFLVCAATVMMAVNGKLSRNGERLGYIALAITILCFILDAVVPPRQINVSDCFDAISASGILHILWTGLSYLAVILSVLAFALLVVYAIGHTS